MHTYPSQCGRRLPLSGSVGCQVAPASSHSSDCISSLRVSQRWICWFPHVPINVNVCTLWKVHCVWEALGFESFQPSLNIYQVSYVFPPSSVSSPGLIQVPGRTCHRSIQILYSSDTLLDGGSLVSHISQHVGRHSSSMSHHKEPHQWMFQLAGCSRVYNCCL